MIQKKIEILDCTFRDGGYYTNWIFNESIFTEYLELCETGVCDIVEIGLRTIRSSSYLGPFAYTSADYFSDCKKYKNLKFSTLVNWNDISNSFSEFSEMFPGIEIDFVQIVRIVVKSIDLNKLSEYILFLKSRGYTVCINIQNCGKLLEYDGQFLKEKITFLNPDILYLADTNGCLTPFQTKTLVDVFVSLTDIPLGMHLHNNQGLAYANALQAIDSGASLIDSTFTGIGRSAGNTQTEFISYYLKNLSLSQIGSISKIIEKYFLPLKKKFLWGENYFYFLSGVNNQSASLMHNLLNNKTYPDESILRLASTDQSDTISNLVIHNETDNSYTIKKPDAIIIANGDDWLLEKKQIINYLINRKIETIHINYPKIRETIPYISNFCSCDPIKISSDIESYQNMRDIPLICPNNLLDKLDLDMESLKKVSYDCDITKSNLKITSNKCFIPNVQSLCYGLAYLYANGFRNILLIGVQGFREPKKNLELINCLSLFGIEYQDLQITSLSNNSLGIKSKSIFEVMNIK